MSPDELVTELVDRRYDALLRRAYLLCGDRSTAEDLVQETAIRLLRAARRYDIEKLDAYAHRTMVNLYVHEARRRSRAVLAVVEPEPQASESGLVDERSAIWTVLQELPRMQRAVLVLRFYEDLTESGIAAVMGVSVGTVRTHSARGLAKVRAALTDSVGEADGH